MKTVLTNTVTQYALRAVKQQHLILGIFVPIVKAKKMTIKGDLKMKKLFAFLLLIARCVSLVACGNSSSQNSSNEDIKLSLDNYEDYISVYAKVYGDGYSTWSSYVSDFLYGDATAEAQISGISNYEYNDVVITVTVYFSYGSTERSIPLNIKLNKGGSGKSSKTIDINDGLWANEWIQKYAYYNVTAVSGSVSRID